MDSQVCPRIPVRGRFGSDYQSCRTGVGKRPGLDGFYAVWEVFVDNAQHLLVVELRVTSWSVEAKTDSSPNFAGKRWNIAGSQPDLFAGVDNRLQVVPHSFQRSVPLQMYCNSWNGE